MREEEKIDYFRISVIILNFICLIQLLLAVIFPDALSVVLKTWLITVAGSQFVGLSIALFLAHKDSLVALFLIVLSAFLAGLLCGISILLIVKN